jgi:S1-C subfamily serine protease
MKSRIEMVAFIHIGVVAAFLFAGAMPLTDLAKKVRPATLLLTVSAKDGEIIATGTGFLISGDGLLVTNKHVIERGTQISAKAENGMIYTVLGIVAKAEPDDVVVLKLQGANLPFLIFGDSQTAEVGQRIAVVGNPLGLEGTLSEGIIAAKRQLDGKQWLQITAAISPGSSGSPRRKYRRRSCGCRDAVGAGRSIPQLCGTW